MLYTARVEVSTVQPPTARILWHRRHAPRRSAGRGRGAFTHRSVSMYRCIVGSRDDDDDEPDPAIQKKLEEVRKRREMQAKQRIAADGWDRLKPMSADNHPPDMTWPPPGGVPAPAEIS